MPDIRKRAEGASGSCSELARQAGVAFANAYRELQDEHGPEKLPSPLRQVRACAGLHLTRFGSSSRPGRSPVDGGHAHHRRLPPRHSHTSSKAARSTLIPSVRSLSVEPLVVSGALVQNGHATNGVGSLDDETTNREMSRRCASSWMFWSFFIVAGSASARAYFTSFPVLSDGIAKAILELLPAIAGVGSSRRASAYVILR